MGEPEVGEQEPVGSLAQETARLLHALAAEARRSPLEDGAADSAGHVCTTGWCPICQVVGFVHDNPDVVEQVTDAAVELGRTVRDMLECSVPPSSDDA
ncbi:hypothetical protein [Aeromicrobium sp.]|uniref:hypothetical protein n=1 Tax=Aeromicrobium sp. TaxID=1871063 RepID=UPI003D6B747A